MAEWQLRFRPEDIRALADRYGYEDDVPVLEAGRRARDSGRFSLKDFLDVCYWKTPRSRSKCQKNTAEEVKEITGIALRTPVERVRTEVLRCLHGVELPTASVLLHIAHRDPYPIIDFRALWSMGIEKLPRYYSFSFWTQYVHACRLLAQEHGVDMRTLDRALWQYSKEHQPKLR